MLFLQKYEIYNAKYEQEVKMKISNTHQEFTENLKGPLNKKIMITLLTKVIVYKSYLIQNLLYKTINL